jgi:hypothetical protein
VVALQTPTGGEAQRVALLRDKPALGLVATYICEHFACQAPLVGAAAVEAALGEK